MTQIAELPQPANSPEDQAFDHLDAVHEATVARIDAETDFSESLRGQEYWSVQRQRLEDGIVEDDGLRQARLDRYAAIHDSARSFADANFDTYSRATIAAEGARETAAAHRRANPNIYRQLGDRIARRSIVQQLDIDDAHARQRKAAR